MNDENGARRVARKKPYIRDIIEFTNTRKVTIHGIGKPKTVELPEEVVEWLKNSKVAKRVLEELVTHYKYRIRLSHPGSLRSLLLLLYSRAHRIPPYKTAKLYGIAPEQLYRMERGMKKDGLYELVMNLLALESQNP